MNTKWAFSILSIALCLVALVVVRPFKLFKSAQHSHNENRLPVHSSLENELDMNGDIDEINEDEEQHTVEAIVPVNVIFDLNGVLFTISKKKAMNTLGFFDMLAYTASGNDAHKLESLMFEVMHSYDNHDAVSYAALQGEKLIPLHNDKPLPKIMCEWMRGDFNDNQIIEKLNNHVEKLDKERFFKNSLEKKIVKKIIPMMFDPAIRTELYRPLKRGVAILEQCKQLGHKVYLLSNIDTELVVLLQAKYPEIFALFDGVVISASAKMIKPDANIYQHFLHEHKLDASQCYFIDDQEENIIGAERAGITGIHHNQRRAKKTCRRLAEYRILPQTVLHIKETSDQDIKLVQA